VGGLLAETVNVAAPRVLEETAEGGDDTGMTGAGREREGADEVDDQGRREGGVVGAQALLALLVAVGATVALTSGLATMTGRDVGTVALDPDRPVPDRWDDWYQDVATGVGEFHGLTVIGLENPEDDAACVTVVAPRFPRGANPIGGCAAGSFPARGVLTVTGDMPAELRDEFPEGTALEFVLEGGSVRVTAG